MASKKDELGVDALTKRIATMLSGAEKIMKEATGIREHEKLIVKYGKGKFTASRMNNNIITMVFDNEAEQKKYFDSLKK